MQKDKRRILFVEDHIDTSQVITMFMQEWGYEVANAYSVAEGLSLARSRDFDLFILDYRLPDGTGLELCKQIREFDSQTPVLFYSASAYPKEIEQAMAACAQRYLTKPTDTAELQLTISEMIASECYQNI